MGDYKLMTTIDENYLKTISDKFDTNSIFHLNLSHRNLLNIDKIKLLCNIEILDLSYNKITNIGIISSLQNLKIIDLSFNSIDHIKMD